MAALGRANSQDCTQVAVPGSVCARNSSTHAAPFRRLSRQRPFWQQWLLLAPGRSAAFGPARPTGLEGCILEETLRSLHTQPGLPCTSPASRTSERPIDEAHGGLVRLDSPPAQRVPSAGLLDQDDLITPALACYLLDITVALAPARVSHVAHVSRQQPATQLHPPSPGQARSQRWLLLHDARLRQEIHSPSLSSLLSLSSVTSPSPYRPPPLHLPGLTGVCSWCVVPRGFIFSFTLCIDSIVGFSFVLHPRLIPSRPEPWLSSAHIASRPDSRLSRFLFLTARFSIALSTSLIVFV